LLVDGIDDFVQVLRNDVKDDLAQLFLHQLDLPPFGAQPVQSASDPAHNALAFGRSFVGAKVISLPPPDASLCRRDLVQSLLHRGSDLNYTGAEISLIELATLLGFAMGMTATRKTRSNEPGRTYPSGGGLYPIEPYLYIKHVTGLQEGVYHYSPSSHQLEIINLNPPRLADCFFDELVQPDLQPGWLDNVAFSLILTSASAKSYSKYGDRTWKLVLLEAGHIGQNIYLIASSMERFKVCGLGGFKLLALVRALKIDGYAELPVYPIHVGVGSRVESGLSK
jgi:SagB-type dehydrogenase family enzyme